MRQALEHINATIAAVDEARQTASELPAAISTYETQRAQAEASRNEALGAAATLSATTGQLLSYLQQALDLCPTVREQATNLQELGEKAREDIMAMIAAGGALPLETRVDALHDGLHAASRHLYDASVGSPLEPAIAQPTETAARHVANAKCANGRLSQPELTAEHINYVATVTAGLGSAGRHGVQVAEGAEEAIQDVFGECKEIQDHASGSADNARDFGAMPPSADSLELGAYAATVASELVEADTQLRTSQGLLSAICE